MTACLVRLYSSDILSIMSPAKENKSRDGVLNQSPRSASQQQQIDGRTTVRSRLAADRNYHQEVLSAPSLHDPRDGKALANARRKKRTRRMIIRTPKCISCKTKSPTRSEQCEIGSPLQIKVRACRRDHPIRAAIFYRSLFGWCPMWLVREKFRSWSLKASLESTPEQGFRTMFSRRYAAPAADHLRSGISFSRTYNIPNLIIVYISHSPSKAWNTSLVVRLLHNCMRTETHLLSVKFSSREHWFRTKPATDW